MKMHGYSILGFLGVVAAMLISGRKPEEKEVTADKSAAYYWKK